MRIGKGMKNGKETLPRREQMGMMRQMEELLFR
jgi:hypothetical protein